MIQILKSILRGLGSYLSVFLTSSSVVRYALLPDDLCLEILSKFLSLRGVVRLDTAFCNSKQREWFLKILQCIVLKTHYMASVEEYQWISLRSVRVSKLCVTPHCFNSQENLAVTANCSDICRLQLFDLKVNESSLVSLINRCPKLTVLWIDNTDSFTDNVALSISGLILKQLQKIIIVDHCSTELTCIFVSHFAKCCISLTECDVKLVSENDYTYTNVAVTVLITNNKGLMAIQLRFEKVKIADTIIDTIDKFCPQIQRICIQNYDAVSFSQVAEFIVKRQEQLIWISLIEEKLNDRRFTFVNSSSGNKGIKRVAKSLDIRELDVDSPQRLVEFFTKITGFERLFFSSMTWLVDTDVITALAKFSPNLEYLRLCESGGYNLSMFKELFQGCQQLDKLVLTYCSHVSNVLLEEIFSISNTITALDIKNHASVGNDTIISILTANPQIRTLRCVALDSVDLAALQSAITDRFRHVTLHTESIFERIELD